MFVFVERTEEMSGQRWTVHGSGTKGIVGRKWYGCGEDGWISRTADAPVKLLVEVVGVCHGLLGLGRIL